MNHLLPATYCNTIERNESAVSNVELLPLETSMAESLMLGLRLLDQGVDAAAFEARYQIALHDRFGPIIDELVGLGLLRWDSSRLTLTHRGLMLANDVCARFV